MGQKSETEVGLGTLGIREIIVEFTSLRRMQEIKNDLIASDVALKSVDGSQSSRELEDLQRRSK